MFRENSGPSRIVYTGKIFFKNEKKIQMKRN